MKTETLQVPGASLYYEVRGSGARSARPGSRRADRPAVARNLAIGISVDL